MSAYTTTVSGMIDTVVKRLLWVALVLLVISVSCGQKQQKLLKDWAVAQNGDSGPVSFPCGEGFVRVGSDESSVLTVTIKARESDKDEWQEIGSVVNPNNKKAYDVPIIAGSGWQFRAEVTNYAAGSARVWFYEECK